MTSKEIALPGDLRNRILRGIHYDRTEREEIFNKFVQKFLDLHSEDPENFNKIVVHLDKTLDRKINKPKKSDNVKKLSYRKKKELGLYILGKRSLKYKDIKPLHKLWLEYMTKFMNLEELRKQKWTNSPDDPNFDQVSLKLYRADYHGSIMKVLKSSCPSHIGISGIVVMETKNCFKFLGKDNVVRIVPKASSIFAFEIDKFQFTFFGKNLQVRPAERSSRKLKTVYASELEL